MESFDLVRTVKPEVSIRNFYALRRYYPVIDETLQRVRQYSSTGAALLDWVDGQRIFIRHEETPIAREKASCQCNDRNTATITIVGQETPFLPFLLMHELFHAVQHLAFDTLNIITDLSHTASVSTAGIFYAEAAANAFAARVLYEMRENGYAAPFATMLAGHEGYERYQKIFIGYDKTYRRSQIEGASVEACANQATRQAFDNWFIQENMECYAEPKIIAQLDMLLSKHINPRAAECKLKQSFFTNIATQHDGCPLFTNMQAPPSISACFNNHARLRQLCEVIDHAHIIRSLPHLDIRIQESLRHLQDTDNPYRKINMHLFLKTLKQNADLPRDKQIPLMDIASQVAGLDDHRQGVLDLGTPRPLRKSPGLTS